ncbi:MAG: hypothetical protein Q9217_003040 [Psora testacea]
MNQATVDAIKLKTLGDLAASPSFDIREAPLALTPDSLFVRTPFFNALVACLCNFLPEASAAVQDNTYPSEHQVLVLHLLRTIFDENLPSKLLERNIRIALEAGLISKWLANYPFCAGSGANAATMQKTRDIIRQLLRTNPYDNCHPPDISHILRMLVRDTSASEELSRYGLWDRSFGCEDYKTGQRRRINESPEEVQLRRWRREAMVLGEAGREVRRSDIFERTEDIRDEEIEEELVELLDEVVEAEGRGEGGLRGLWNAVTRLRPDGMAPS